MGGGLQNMLVVLNFFRGKPVDLLPVVIRKETRGMMKIPPNGFFDVNFHAFVRKHLRMNDFRVVVKR